MAWPDESARGGGRRRDHDTFDCLVIGAGIVGLAHALAARRAGLSVAVIERDRKAVGASIRNFGFVTVTGQEAGITWRRAKRSRDVWASVAPAAGIAIHQRGLALAARREEALAVAREFAASPMGAGCEVMTGPEALERLGLRRDLAGALVSPHELRVESREAVGQLAGWLAREFGVTFLTRVAALAVRDGRVETSAGPVSGGMIVVCPGTDLATLFPEVFARRQITLCKLNMMRIADPGLKLASPVMSDLGLVRYLGYAACPSLPALRARLEAEQAAWLADGIHLIAVQGADGSLVVGDSHHYGDAPTPFQAGDVDQRILDELSAVLDLKRPEVVERWVGVYPSGPEAAFIEAVGERVRLVSVTSGTGASTAFALAEETIADLLGVAAPAHAAAA